MARRVRLLTLVARLLGSLLTLLAVLTFAPEGAHADAYDDLDALARATLERLAASGNAAQIMMARNMLGGQPTQFSTTLMHEDGSEVRITPVFSSVGYEGYKVAKTKGDTWISIEHRRSGALEKTRGWVSKSTQWNTTSSLGADGTKRHARIGYSSLGLWNLEVANGKRMHMLKPVLRKR